MPPFLAINIAVMMYHEGSCQLLTQLRYHLSEKEKEKKVQIQQLLTLILLLHLQVELAYFNHGGILPYVIRNLTKQQITALFEYRPLRHPFEFISVVKCEGIKLFNNRKNSHLWDTYFCFLLNAIEGWVQCKHVFLYEERRSIFFQSILFLFYFLDLVERIGCCSVHEITATLTFRLHICDCFEG